MLFDIFVSKGAEIGAKTSTPFGIAQDAASIRRR